MRDAVPGAGGRRLDGKMLAIAMTLPAAAAWLYFVTFAGDPLVPVVYGACKVVQFSLPVAAALLLRPRRSALPPLSSGGVGWGLAWGVLLAAVVLGVYAAFYRDGELMSAAGPRIASRIDSFGAGSPLRYAALAFFISAIHSFLEEYYWRWFVYGRLAARAGPTAALVGSSLAFMAHHVIVIHAFMGAERFWTATVPFSLAVAAGGGLWAVLYARTGSLTAPWISHVFVDAALMAIGSDVKWRG